MTGFAGGGGSSTGGTGITGTLTPPHIPVATGAHTLGDSIITQPNGIVITGTANAKQLEIIGNATQTAALASFERSTSIPAFQLFASSGFQGSSWEGMEHTGSTYTMAMLNDWTGAELSGLGVGANGLVLSSAYQVSWGDTVNDIFGNVTDTGLARSSAGIVSFTGGSSSSKGGFLSQKGSSIVGSANETQLLIVANATQTSPPVLRIQANTSVNDTLDMSNALTVSGNTNATGIMFQLVTADSSLRLGAPGFISFNSVAGLQAGALDTGIHRSSAGIVAFDAGGGTGNGGFLAQKGSSVVGHADEVQLTVKANGTQTANIQSWTNSIGTDLLHITPTGNIYTTGDSWGVNFHVGGFGVALIDASTTQFIAVKDDGSGVLCSGQMMIGATDNGLARAAAAVNRITNGSTGSGSLIIGASTASIGTSGVGVLAIGTGTAPSSSPADEFQLYSADQNGVAGNAAMHVRTEVGSFISVISSAGNFYKRWTQVDTSGTITVSVAQSGTVFANTGASGLVTYNLPAAATGLTYAFCVLDANGSRVVAAGSDVIYIGSSVTTAGGNIQSTTVGSAVLLVAVGATNWVAIGLTGVWATA